MPLNSPTEREGFPANAKREGFINIFTIYVLFYYSLRPNSRVFLSSVPSLHLNFEEAIPSKTTRNTDYIKCSTHQGAAALFLV